ncbi:MAG: hypothetical protein ACLR7U_00250 [Ruthenibacterium lactatiformans]
MKLHCSVLAEQAVKAALADYYRRQAWTPSRLSTSWRGLPRLCL